MNDWLLVLLGFGLLVGGGEALVRGATGIAWLAKVTPVVIGLTVVAAGTSMPEFVVSIQAALADSPGLAVGNVVGSNIFNIGAIVGLAALIHPLRIQGNTVRLEWPVMMLAAFLLQVLSQDAVVDRIEGSFLCTAMVSFTGYAIWVGRKQTSATERVEFEEMVTASFGRIGASALLFNVLAVALGVTMLIGGSTMLVRGAVGIARALQVSDTVIGLTIVAAGTSTPELVTSLVAARRGQDDIAIGNVIGSNIFNILGIVGATALIEPLPVPEEISGRDNWWMIGASLLLFPLMKSGMRVTRGEGALLLLGFGCYLAVLLAAA